METAAHMMAAPAKSHVVRFMGAETEGLERLEFLIFRFPLFLRFVIQYCLRAFAPCIRTPYHHLFHEIITIKSLFRKITCI
jgi:hypothetical protein